MKNDTPFFLAHLERCTMHDVTELLKRAINGDRQAQDELYRRTEPELQKLAWHWIRSYHAKGRVTTTGVIDWAFVKLMQIDSPNWEHRGHFYAYASNNIRWVLIKALKELNGLPGQVDGVNLDGMPAPAEGLALQTLLALQEAIENLGRDISEEHRRVAELRYLLGYKLREVSKLLSINQSKAFQMSTIALEYLREKLRPYCAEIG